MELPFLAGLAECLYYQSHFSLQQVLLLELEPSTKKNFLRVLIDIEDYHRPLRPLKWSMLVDFHRRYFYTVDTVIDPHQYSNAAENSARLCARLGHVSLLRQLWPEVAPYEAENIFWDALKHCAPPKSLDFIWTQIDFDLELLHDAVGLSLEKGQPQVYSWVMQQLQDSKETVQWMLLVDKVLQPDNWWAIETLLDQLQLQQGGPLLGLFMRTTQRQLCTGPLILSQLRQLEALLQRRRLPYSYQEALQSWLSSQPVDSQLEVTQYLLQDCQLYRLQPSYCFHLMELLSRHQPRTFELLYWVGRQQGLAVNVQSLKSSLPPENMPASKWNWTWPDAWPAS